MPLGNFRAYVARPVFPVALEVDTLTAADTGTDLNVRLKVNRSAASGARRSWIPSVYRPRPPNEGGTAVFAKGFDLRCMQVL